MSPQHLTQTCRGLPVLPTRGGRQCTAAQQAVCQGWGAQDPGDHQHLCQPNAEADASPIPESSGRVQAGEQGAGHGGRSFQTDLLTGFRDALYTPRGARPVAPGSGDALGGSARLLWEARAVPARRAGAAGAAGAPGRARHGQGQGRAGMRQVPGAGTRRALCPRSPQIVRLSACDSSPSQKGGGRKDDRGNKPGRGAMKGRWGEKKRREKQREE